MASAAPQQPALVDKEHSRSAIWKILDMKQMNMESRRTQASQYARVATEQC